MAFDRWTNVLILTLVVLCTSLNAPAAADSLRCAGKIVSLGDSTYRVRSLCGDPIDVVARTEWRTLTRRIPDPGCVPGDSGRPCTAFEESGQEIQIEQWTYDLGRKRLIQHLTFEHGVLREIRSGDYGAGGG